MTLRQIQVSLTSSWGGDRNAAEAAWASSFDKDKLESRTEDDVRRVVTGVVNNAHDTPKERIWGEFFIRCPIFCERQYDKYRMTVQYQDFRIEYLQAEFGRNGITQNELSGRYRTLPDRPYGLPQDVAQILSKATNCPAEDEHTAWRDLMATQYEAYEYAIGCLKRAEKSELITNAEYKRAREVYRGVLGTGFMTDMRIVMNLNAFEHIVNQRLAVDTQPESRVIAHLMIEELKNSQIAPTIVHAMIAKNNWAPLQTGVRELLDADYEP